MINSSRYLAFGVYFSLHQRNIAYEYKLHGKSVMKQKQYFHLFLKLMLKKPVFVNIKLKPFMNNLYFSQFHEYIFRSNCSQMFFKVGGLKNFTIFLIKKRLQSRYFPVRSANIAKFLKEKLFSRTHQMTVLLFFKKLIKQPFRNVFMMS